MIQVPTYAEFEKALERITALEQENKILRQFLEGKAVSRERAMEILNCGKDTLNRITKAGEVKFNQDKPGGKILYDSESLYNYLNKNMIDRNSIRKKNRNKV
jgi:hypothetical protein